MRTLLSMIALSVAMTACGDAAVGGGDVIEIDGGADTSFDGGADVGSDSFGDASDSGFDVQTDSGGTDSASDVNGSDSATDAEVEDAFLDSGDAEGSDDPTCEGSGIEDFNVFVEAGRILNGTESVVNDGDYASCVTVGSNSAPEIRIEFSEYANVSSLRISSGFISNGTFDLRNFTITSEDRLGERTEWIESDAVVECYGIDRNTRNIWITLNNEGVLRPMTICEVEVFTAE